MEDTRVYRGADAASDRYLLVMKIKLKLHRNANRAKCNARFDTHELQSEMFKSRFSVELRKRFAALEVEKNINEDCIQMEKKFTHKMPKKEGNQAMAKGENLESNRPTTDDP